jgi:hypothetical protein
MANRVNIFELEVADAGPGINKDIVIDQHRRCARSGADASTAT